METRSLILYTVCLLVQTKMLEPVTDFTDEHTDACKYAMLGFLVVGAIFIVAGTALVCHCKYDIRPLADCPG